MRGRPRARAVSHEECLPVEHRRGDDRSSPDAAIRLRQLRCARHHDRRTRSANVQVQSVDRSMQWGSLCHGLRRRLHMPDNRTSCSVVMPGEHDALHRSVRIHVILRQRMIYTFGPFRLDARERQLLRDGTLVPLSGKAFDTLVALVENVGTLQRQQVLMERLWPDTCVEPNSLQYNVSLVRRVIDGAPGVEIQTVRGQGYRLVAQVTCDAGDAQAAAARLQRTYFCKAPDGTRLAYAKLGDGPPLMKAASWLSHLELDWQGDVWKHVLELFARD